MIENRQKTPSGPQGVLLGVPKYPRPPKWRSKMPKCGHQSSQISGFDAKKVASQRARESRIGGRRQRAKPLRIIQINGMVYRGRDILAI